MTGPHADTPVPLSATDEAVLAATVAVHANRGPDGVCRFCGVRSCEVRQNAVVTLRSAGINVEGHHPIGS